MKTTYYKGWRIYHTKGGSHNNLAQLNAKHPLRVAKISATVPDSGNISFALGYLKRDIDAIELINPT
jgi:hypothetical protein